MRFLWSHKVDLNAFADSVAPPFHIVLRWGNSDSKVNKKSRLLQKTLFHNHADIIKDIIIKEERSARKIFLAILFDCNQLSRIWAKDGRSCAQGSLYIFKMCLSMVKLKRPWNPVRPSTKCLRNMLALIPAAGFLAYYMLNFKKLLLGCCRGIAQ